MILFRITRIKKSMSWIFLISFVWQILFPTASYALTGGPSQPEVQSFTPASVTEMVDPFSGDFAYNIPLLKVGDYPINISYNSGISMDQEASWVGLGWNLNCGVINRSMRGIPDDFDGDIIEKDLNLKPNRTFGVTLKGNLEFTGIPLSLAYGSSLKYNNYNGFGIEKSLAVTLNSGSAASTNPFNASLGITASNDEGLSIQPSIGISNKFKDIENKTSISTSWNNRSGLKQLTLSNDITVNSITKPKEGEKEGKEVSGSTTVQSSFNLGMQTFTPSIQPNYNNYSISANFRSSTAIPPFITPGVTFGGYYSQQSLNSHNLKNKSYGYMNCENAITNDNALMDFNREKDGSYSANVPSLPLTNFTYDLFNASGQGISGSYRPFRSDIGYIFDSKGATSSTGGSMGFDLGAGNLLHVGTDFSITWVQSETKRWNTQNPSAKLLSFKKSTGNILYEPYYFKEANEATVDNDPQFTANVGGYAPVKFGFNEVGKDHWTNGTLKSNAGVVSTMSSTNYRQNRENRNQNIHILKVEDVRLNFGLNEYGSVPGKLPLYTLAPNHHIGEINVQANDGSRYVYGLPAYNLKQEETSFAVGKTLLENGTNLPGDLATGLLNYSSYTSANSISNKKGIDNYYSNTKLPAYAHSYLLTAVLSADYVDIDDVKGPSDNDFGNYTRFEYFKISNFKWRTPYGQNIATYSEGLKSDYHDDKANYIYGEKELFYLSKVESRDYIAIFELENRDDGLGVQDKNGGKNTAIKLKSLKSITLYNKKDYQNSPITAVPLKKVHFEYDYSLCPGVENNVYSGQGKLTLKKIYFTYQNSKKAVFSRYEFEYCTQKYPNGTDFQNNYSYNIANYNRWGGYKFNTTPLYNSDFPYVSQENRNLADAYASAWSLTKIHLPSGGTINIDYEADDYAFVQNKRAMQMMTICDVLTAKPNSTYTSSGSTSSVQLDNHNSDYFFIFKKDATSNISEYFKDISKIYFKCLMLIKGSSYDYVTGYGIPIEHGQINNDYGYVRFQEMTLKDQVGNSYPPMVRAAIQFGRIANPKLVWGDDTYFGEDSRSLSYNLVRALLGSSILNLMKNNLSNPNTALFNQGVGTQIVLNKSWIRLNNANKHKIGGGSRVKQITIDDNWSAMTSSEESSSQYGQTFEYILPDGSSSGVATYEPQIGGDENPWRQPDFYDIKNTLIPDDRFYIESPYGETFFPAPSVGYSRVIIKNLPRTGVTRHATGKTINEYYTAFDFPTITSMTTPDPKPKKNNPFSIAALFKISSYSYMTTTQGFAIELNDMHGKPKKVSIYQEGQNTPITSTTYIYKSEPFGVASRKLVNEANVISRNGEVSYDQPFGVYFDMVADMRENSTKSQGLTISANLDAFLALLAPIFAPGIYPSYFCDKTRFRSATTTKVIQRFGILESVIYEDVGSKTISTTIAYDKETGTPVVTQANTDFNDPIYSLNIPAYWYYERMGQASKNIGVELPSLYVTDLNDHSTFYVSNASNYFIQGDVLQMSGSIQGYKKGFVMEVNSNTVKVVNVHGLSIPADNYSIKIIQSGYKNVLNAQIMSLQTLSNPLNSLTTNLYEKVINSSAIEYYDKWKLYCECIFGFVPNANTVNIKKITSVFVPQKAYAFITDRTQSHYNNNSSIRNDGTFVSYNPFYFNDNGKWRIDLKNWTSATEITQFSMHSKELEEKNALGKYSSATYGYFQSLPTASASNAKYTEVAFDGFEDYNYAPCVDNHFKFQNFASNITDEESHTGTQSIKVSEGTNVTLMKDIFQCEIGDHCNLISTLNYVSTANGLDTYSLTVTNGIAPFSISPTIYSGSVNVSVTNNGSIINIVTQGNAKFDLVIKDGNQCAIQQYYAVSPH